MKNAVTKHLSIGGTVQGVGYRVSFAAQARALGIVGWVRNRQNGSVEALVCGDENAIDKLLVWSRRGPAFARVDNVTVTDTEAVPTVYEKFDILADG